MDKAQLNNLALAAQNGDQDAMWLIKYHFQEYIAKTSDINRNKLTNQEAFEEQCYKLVESTVKRFNPNLGSLDWLVKTSIIRRLSRSTNRFGKKTKGAIITRLPTLVDDEGHEEDALKDDLAIIDSNFLFKERITGLAAGDSVRLAILNAWSEATRTNDLETAKMLAHRYGGKPESHRKAIIRFRSKCQVTLANVI